jgi:hypothetical protein
MATHCSRCGGELTRYARFCTIVAYRCRLCRTFSTQAVPPAVAVTIR